MDREILRNKMLKWIENNIKKYGENTVALASPQIGKNSWTWKEYKQAVLEDKSLENAGNPIDYMLDYNNYLIKHRGYGLEKQL